MKPTYGWNRGSGDLKSYEIRTLVCCTSVFVTWRPSNQYGASTFFDFLPPFWLSFRAAAAPVRERGTICVCIVPGCRLGPAWPRPDTTYAEISPHTGRRRSAAARALRFACADL